VNKIAWFLRSKKFCEPSSKFFRWKKIYVFFKIILTDKVGEAV